MIRPPSIMTPSYSYVSVTLSGQKMNKKKWKIREICVITLIVQRMKTVIHLLFGNLALPSDQDFRGECPGSPLPPL